MTALMGLSSRMRTARLMLITDLRADEGDFREVVLAALRGGVDVVQVRDPRASDEQLTEALELARSAALQLNATIVVGHRLGVASAFAADAVHLASGGEEVERARGQLPQHALVGRSAHDAAELADDGADYLLVGPVYGAAPLMETPGLDLVRRAAEVQPVADLDATPWFAVGGIHEGNLADVLDAGAVRVAVTGAILNAADPQAAAERLRAAVQAAWDRRPEMESYAIKSLGGGTARFITG